MQALILPNHLKAELKVPHGVLYAGCGRSTMDELKMALDSENPARIISVGDITTCNLIESGVLPDICIVDHLTCRTAVSDQVVNRIHNPEFREVSVENPAGSITLELVANIKAALRSDDRVLIFVHGEEDLAVMPAVTLAPVSSIVIYGQPSSGCVLINVTREKKKEMQELLKQMKHSNHGADDIWRILE